MVSAGTTAPARRPQCGHMKSAGTGCPRRFRRMVDKSGLMMFEGARSTVLVRTPHSVFRNQMLWSIATMRTFFASNTRVQLATVSNSALVGL